MQELRELLTVRPISDSGPLYPSIRALAAHVASLEGENKFAGKLDSANAAINAVVRGDRPFTSDLRGLLVRAVRNQVDTFEEGSTAYVAAGLILAELEGLSTSGRRRPHGRVEGLDQFAEIAKRFEQASDAFMIRPVPRPGIVAESHPMRRLLFKKLGFFRSAPLLGETPSGLENYATARISFVVASAEHAVRGWESFLLQSIGANSGNPMGVEESLDLEEALQRIRALEDADLLRIYVADPSLCVAPIHVHNPSSDALVEGWIIFYRAGGSATTLEVPIEHLAQFQEMIFQRIENGQLPGTRRIRWDDEPRDAIIARARSLKLVQD